MTRLYTFLVSHFSEKARFALDRAGVDYEERPLWPGLHALTTRRLAPKSSVPVLVHDGRVVQGSSDIVDFVDAQLGGSLTPPDPSEAARAKELEALADRAFGRGIQTIVYAYLLPHREAVVDLWVQDGSRAGRAFYALTYPLLARGLRAGYRATPEGAAPARERLLRALDETDRALDGGGRFLVGDALSRADVAVAALLAPIVMPDNHASRWPSVLPPELDAFAREIDERPTLAHVRRVYAEHR